MSLSKLEQVRYLLANTNAVETNRSVPPESNEVQLAYLNGLEHDIKNTEKFLHQADRAIKVLSESTIQDTTNDNETETKKRILALQDTCSKIPYVPSKNDVIGISTASKTVHELVGQNTKGVSEMKQRTKKYDAQSEVLNSHISDYRQMIEQLGSRIAKEPTKVEKLSGKIDQITNTDFSVESQLNSLQFRIIEATKTEKTISSHLKRIIAKLLAFQDWSNQNVADQNGFKENILSSLNVIHSLVENLLKSVQTNNDQVWLEIKPTAVDENLIQVLIRNNVVISRDDSTADTYYLKLRKFGIEF